MSDTDEHTFLFADLSGFTALTEVHDDEEAAELAAWIWHGRGRFRTSAGAKELAAGALARA